MASVNASTGSELTRFSWNGVTVLQNGCVPDQRWRWLSIYLFIYLFFFFSLSHTGFGTRVVQRFAEVLGCVSEGGVYS